MDWRFYDEAVELLGLRFNYLPQLFRWRGRFHEVEAVERCWTVARGRRGDGIQRRYFRVQCGDGSYELYQDLVMGTWHVRRARNAPRRAWGVRRLASAWR
jgi:hypothetical protein